MPGPCVYLCGDKGRMALRYPMIRPIGIQREATDDTRQGQLQGSSVRRFSPWSCHLAYALKLSFCIIPAPRHELLVGWLYFISRYVGCSYSGHTRGGLLRRARSSHLWRLVVSRYGTRLGRCVRPGLVRHVDRLTTRTHPRYGNSRFFVGVDSGEERL